jgi:hypothetical protein
MNLIKRSAKDVQDVSLFYRRDFLWLKAKYNLLNLQTSRRGKYVSSSRPIIHYPEPVNKGLMISIRVSTIMDPLAVGVCEAENNFGWWNGLVRAQANRVKKIPRFYRTRPSTGNLFLTGWILTQVLSDIFQISNLKYYEF